MRKGPNEDGDGGREDRVTKGGPLQSQARSSAELCLSGAPMAVVSCGAGENLRDVGSCVPWKL